MLGTLARHRLALGLVKELAHIELVIRPRGDADPLYYGAVQLRPARITPVKARKGLGLVRAGQTQDAATEFVGAADGRLDSWPPLAEQDRA